MFEVHCPTHDSRVLLTTRAILALEPTVAGIELRWRCWCGHVGTTLTGRPSPDRHPIRPGAAA